jgi:hypothetical protein
LEYRRRVVEADRFANFGACIERQREEATVAAAEIEDA